MKKLKLWFQKWSCQVVLSSAFSHRQRHHLDNCTQNSWYRLRPNNCLSTVIVFPDIIHHPGHNSFTSQYLLNIYIYCRFCRLRMYNKCVKKLTFGNVYPSLMSYSHRYLIRMSTQSSNYCFLRSGRTMKLTWQSHLLLKLKHGAWTRHWHYFSF
jgi:hypothetical protein